MSKPMIRRATVNDAAALRVLRLQALQTAPEAFGSDYESEAQRPLAFWEDRLANTANQCYFVGEAGGEFIAMAGGLRQERQKNRHTVHVIAVFVQPEHRGHGLSEKLVNAVLGWARTLPGASVAKLAVITSNTPAIKTYLRCGFSIYGVEPKVLYVNGAYHDEFLMAQEI
jgi:RimJ/RimL family protein N-acetyltransferase